MTQFPPFKHYQGPKPGFHFEKLQVPHDFYLGSKGEMPQPGQSTIIRTADDIAANLQQSSETA